MTSEDFTKLYKKQKSDEILTPLRDSVGFTLVRNYKEVSPYFKDGKKMFIRLSVSADNVIQGGIDMVQPNKERTGEMTYSVTSNDLYGRKITNFFLSDDDQITFDGTKILYQPKKLQFNLNEFVDILEKNHLTDKLLVKRIKNSFVNFALKLLFWLSDKHYEKISVMLNIHDGNQNNKHSSADDKDTEPFFKYFHIPRNTLLCLFFVIFLISLCFSKNIEASYYTLSNPSLVLFVFLLLFIIEKISIRLNLKIKGFFNKEQNFISKYHKYQYHNQFKLNYFR